MSWEVRQGDVLAELALLASGSVDCIVTSPPYWGLRDYGVPDAWGLEPTLGEYLDRMRSLGSELMRVLKPSGTFWLNMGDAYAGSWSGNSMRPDGGNQREGTPGFQPLDSRYAAKNGKVPSGLKAKDLIGLPWRVAFALQEQGWYLRSDIIWAKPNPMPESVTDRPTKSHEYIFLLTKNARYAYDADAIADPAIYWDDDRASRGDARRGTECNAMYGRSDAPKGSFNGKHGDEAFRAIRETRNARTVWTISTTPYPEAHFATFPQELPKRCILAGCPEGGLVLDPFAGSGTTLEVALRLGRNAVGIELNPDYIRLIEARMKTVTPSLFGSATQGGTG